MPDIQPLVPPPPHAITDSLIDYKAAALQVEQRQPTPHQDVVENILGFYQVFPVFQVISNPVTSVLGRFLAQNIYFNFIFRQYRAMSYYV
jgi:sorbitol-specific phosphotransferase system component IIC